MKQLVPWIFVIIGIVYLLPLLTLEFLGEIGSWIIALGFLLIGIIYLTSK